MYDAGEGVPLDYVLARMWFNLAAARGLEVAREYGDEFAKRMTPADIIEAQRLAREWLEQHAE
jgi:TPR repeat protein